MKKVIVLVLCLFLLTACTPDVPAIPDDPALRWQVAIDCDGVYALSFGISLNGVLHSTLGVCNADTDRPLKKGETVHGDVLLSELPEGWQSSRIGIAVTVTTAGERAYVLPTRFAWPADPNYTARFALTGSAEEGFTLTPADGAIIPAE